MYKKTKICKLNVLSLISIIWVILFSSPFINAQYSTVVPSTITGTSLSFNNASAITEDGNGCYYICYSATYNDYKHVFVRKSEDSGMTWKYWNGTGFDISGGEVPIENLGDYDQYCPSIGIDSENNLHVVWHGKSTVSPSKYQIRYSKYNGASWSSPADITLENYDQWYPSIRIDHENNLHVVWQGKSTSSPSYDQIRYSKYNGISWSSLADITSGNYSQGHPSIGIDSENNLHVVWHGKSVTSASYYQIRYSKYDEESWSSPVDITSGNYHQWLSSIGIDSENNLHVMWQGNTAKSPSYWQIRYSKYDGKSWNSLTDITSENYDQWTPSIGIDSENNLHVVWYGMSSESPSYNHIRYIKHTTAWLSPINITSGSYNQYSPQLTTEGSMIVWGGTTDSLGVSISTEGLMVKITPPIGTISINGGVDITNDTSVTLSVYASVYDPDLAQMKISNNFDFNGVSWEAYATSKAWTLSAGDETKTVYIKYKDELGNESGAFTDTIILDTTGPEAPIVTPAGGTYNTAQSITLSEAIDVETTYYTLDSSEPDNTDTIYIGAIDVDGANGETVVLKAISYDEANNKGSIITQYYVFDKEPPNTEGPTATIIINNDDAITNSTTVSLSIYATDINGVGQMMVSNYSDFTGAEWESYSSNKDWFLLNGNGTKTVYIKFKDNLGKESGIYSDTITLNIPIPSAPPADTEGPVAPKANPQGGIYNTAIEITIIPANDAVETYYTLDGTEPDKAKTKYTEIISVDGENGTNITLTAVSYDALGNKGMIETQIYVFDKEGPISPKADPMGGIYTKVQSITVTTAEDATETFYTLDGTNPDRGGLPYTGAIAINGQKGDKIALKAVSYDKAGNRGQVMTEEYVFEEEVFPSLPIQPTEPQNPELPIGPTEPTEPTNNTNSYNKPNNTSNHNSNDSNVNNYSEVNLPSIELNLPSIEASNNEANINNSSPEINEDTLSKPVDVENWQAKLSNEITNKTNQNKTNTKVIVAVTTGTAVVSLAAAGAIAVSSGALGAIGATTAGATGTSASIFINIARSIWAWTRRINRNRRKIYKSFRRAEKLKRGISLMDENNLEQQIEAIRKLRFTFVNVNIYLNKIFSFENPGILNKVELEKVDKIIRKILQARISVNLKLDLGQHFINKVSNDNRFSDIYMQNCESLGRFLSDYKSNRLFIEMPYIPCLSDKFIRAIRRGNRKHTIILSDMDINDMLQMSKPKFKNIICNFNLVENKHEVLKIKNIIRVVYKWSNKNKVPVISTIQGTESKVWLKKVRRILKRYFIGWSIDNYSAIFDKGIIKALRLKKIIKSKARKYLN